MTNEATTPSNSEKKPLHQRIVLIDSDETLLEVLEQVLKTSTVDIITFSNGEDAKNYIFNPINFSSISLIVLERLLPDMDGIHILEDIVKKSDPHMPILILSTLSSKKDVIEGLKDGAYDYIAKPFSLADFVEKVELLLERDQLQHQKEEHR